MIELTEGMLEKLHEIELEMLLEVDRICRKNQINYTIIGGTLLGAVRHGGFIPWDDDADIAMLRPEYEKFTEAVKRELDRDRFYFQDMDVTEGYRWGYGKLRRKDTLFLRKHQEEMPYEQGVFLDIFPQDAVPDSPAGRKLQDFLCFLLRKALWSEVGRRAEKSRGLRLWYSLVSRLPRRLLIKMYRGLILRKEDTELVRTLTFPAPGKKYGYRREWLTETADIPFQGELLRGVKDFDGWLRWEYGEYRKEPPLEKRKCHPVSAIRLL